MQNLSNLNMNLIDNGISNKGAEEFGDGVSKLLNLKFLELNFSSNSIGVQGAV